MTTAPTPGGAYKRRLIPIVNRRFQFKYTAAIVAIAALISTVLGFLLLKSYWEMNDVIDLATIAPEVHDKLNSEDAQKVFKITIAFLVLEVIGLGFMGLVITHRVCGPVFVLQRHFGTLLEGKYPQTRPLRTGDEFGQAFELFTALVDQMKKRDVDEIEKLRTVLSQAKAKGMTDAETAPLVALIADREARQAKA